jgi:GAF domain-containing protein
LFFRDRIDLQRSLERVVEEMTTLLDLGRIVGLLTRTVEQVLHPTRQALLLVEESTGDFRAAGEDAESEPRLLSGSSLPIALGRVRDAVSLERLEEDPRLRDLREGGTAQMTALGADLVVPVVIRDRVTGCLVLGGKRAGTAYSSEDLRLLRLLVNQSALALEHAKSYTALERANAELRWPSSASRSWRASGRTWPSSFPGRCRT